MHELQSYLLSQCSENELNRPSVFPAWHQSMTGFEKATACLYAYASGMCVSAQWPIVIKQQFVHFYLQALWVPLKLCVTSLKAAVWHISPVVAACWFWAFVLSLDRHMSCFFLHVCYRQCSECFVVRYQGHGVPQLVDSLRRKLSVCWETHGERWLRLSTITHFPIRKDVLAPRLLLWNQGQTIPSFLPVMPPQGVSHSHCSFETEVVRASMCVHFFFLFCSSYSDANSFEFLTFLSVSLHLSTVSHDHFPAFTSFIAQLNELVTSHQLNPPPIPPTTTVKY